MKDSVEGILNTAEVAEKLGTTPKTLRRFLRDDPTYNNPGIGGTYQFESTDLPTMKHRFDSWLTKKPAPRNKKPVTQKSVKKSRRNGKMPANQDTPFPVSILERKLSRAEREKRDALSRARVERLEQRVINAGLHVSQRKG